MFRTLNSQCNFEICDINYTYNDIFMDAGGKILSVHHTDFINVTAFTLKTTMGCVCAYFFLYILAVTQMRSFLGGFNCFSSIYVLLFL